MPGLGMERDREKGKEEEKEKEKERRSGMGGLRCAVLATVCCHGTAATMMTRTRIT